MSDEEALRVMSALSMRTRLEAFRKLATALPDGINAGDLAERLSIPRNLMSSHLAVLSAAKLVVSERSGRNLVYRAVTLPVLEAAALLTEACAIRTDDRS